MAGPRRTTGRRRSLVVALLVGLVWLLAAGAAVPASAVIPERTATDTDTETETDADLDPDPDPGPGPDPDPDPDPAEPDVTGTQDATPDGTQGTDDPTADPDDTATSEPTPTGPPVPVEPSTAPPSGGEPTTQPGTGGVRPATAPAVQTSTIPPGSVVLSLLVLLAGTLLVRTALRRAPDDPVDPAVAPALPAGAAAHPETRPATGPVTHSAPGAPGTDPATLEFLLELGRALVDAGDAITHVQETLEEVAVVNGVQDAGIMAMPTALVISLHDARGVQTEVTTAGESTLRLDQVDQVFRVVADARSGRLAPTDGLAAVAAVRAAPPPYTPALQLLGHVLFTLGLVLLLRGGWQELALGALLGVGVGALNLATDRLRSGYQAVAPVVAALGVSVTVLTAARFFPELAVFPPLVAALVAFLPGGLLTTAVFELSTGQLISGSGRLAAGGLRLVLLALGILAGAQLVGVPAATIGGPSSGAVTVLAPWLGVAVFGLGVVLFRGARWSSLPWVLLVLYVAYAGQVIGGLFFGSTLSAFFGALAMTPVAVVAARQESGPPALVSFLPGFWLLVPGAVGLQGVTRFLDEDTVEGVSSLVSMGTSMVGIALGVLLGLTIGAEVAARTGLAGRAARQAVTTPADGTSANSGTGRGTGTGPSS